MKKIDFHLHTDRYSACSKMSPQELAERLPSSGLDGAVITEHDYQWSRTELARLQEMVPRVKLYTAVEVSCPEGHFIIFGAERTGPWEPRRSIHQWSAELDGTGAAIVWTHPGRFGISSDIEARAILPLIHGMEVMSLNIKRKQIPLLDAIRSRSAIVGLAASDSHRTDAVGLYATLFPELPADENDLSKMIREADLIPWADQAGVAARNREIADIQENLLP